MSLRFCIVATAIVVLGFSAGAVAGRQHEAGAQSSAAGGYGLHLVDDGDHIKLAYGQANSDNVGLMLDCAKGSRRIEVSDFQRGADSRSIRLASGDQHSDLRAELQEFEGAKLLLAGAATSDPALAQFHQTGKLKVATGGLTYTVTANPGQQAAVDQFFAVCNRA